VKLSVIMACHNRKDLTVRSVERAQAAAKHAGIDISFTIFDDGSSDGTAEALATLPYSIRILQGDGSAYWANSMAQAERAALESDELTPEDFLVWLNDDVALDETAFASIRTTIDGTNPGTVIVGAMRDPSTGSVTYSGLRRHGPHPLSFALVPPQETLQQIDTFNGNLVVVPVSVARRLGGIDGGFSHALADIDYGLRSMRAGVAVVLAPGTQGTCSRNPVATRRTAREDWRSFTGAKGGGNYRSLKRVLRKSNRNSWPLVVLTSYCLWWVRRAVPLLARDRVVR
jgi:GT2 family glycosyltransferase